ncbi:MAG: 3D domain-containing protein [Eubacterium sp.]|nr:3D domain-containing protein [Eubacterium sp.]
MKTLRKVMLVTTVSIVSFVGLNTPTDKITAESLRLYETTHSADIHSSVFQSLDSEETEIEKILNDNKTELVLETNENVPQQETSNEDIKVESIDAKIEVPVENDKEPHECVYISEDAVAINPETDKPEKSRSYAGSYELTAYIATGCPCADGNYPQVGHTVACNDPALWHKWIEIEGYGVYYVHDTGGMASNVIDVFVGSYNEAIQFGRRSANIYVLEY